MAHSKELGAVCILGLSLVACGDGDREFSAADRAFGGVFALLDPLRPSRGRSNEA